MSALLEASGVSVAFGGLRALEDFAVTVAEGEFHGVIGPNGAGKTTAINALTGFLSRSGGQVRFAGGDLPRQPHRIAMAGVGRTFQSPTIFSALSAVKNVMCGGHRWTKSGLVAALFRAPEAMREEDTLRQEAIGWLQKVGFAYPPDAPVTALPFGELRKLEIARALMARPRLLMLDEPTAGLTADEVYGIGRMLRSVTTADGKPMSVVLIEHNVPFVFSVCDRVTAVDKGRIIACGPPDEVRNNQAVIESYLGSGAWAADPVVTSASTPRRAPAEEKPVLFEVRNVSAGYGRMTVVEDISLSIREGELVILCGRNGAGKSTILNAVAGHPPVKSGEVLLRGQHLEGMSVSAIVRAGVGLVPQERGIIAGQSIEANLRLATIGLDLGRAGFAQRRDEMYQRFPKLGERRDQLAGTLSGGERQMLSLAKVLIRRPLLMLLDEPTIGLAPTIVEELQRIVAQINADGISLIVAEQSVNWVASLASRAYLLERGRIVSSGPPGEIIRQEHIIESYLGEADAGRDAQRAVSA